MSGDPWLGGALHDAPPRSHLSDLNEDLQMSPTIGKIAEALAKAQGMMENAATDKVNPHYGSKYAALGSIWDAIRAPLSQHNLAVTQLCRNDVEGRVTLDTLLMHTSGEWIRSRLTMKPAQDTPQGVGSCLTYARRYALGAITGIATEADDDGNAASREPARGNTASAFKAGDQASHTNVQQAMSPETQRAMAAGAVRGAAQGSAKSASAPPPPPSKPPATPAKPAGKPAAARQTPEPPGKAALGKPKPAEGPAIEDDEWDKQRLIWGEDPVAMEHVADLKDYYGLRTTDDLTKTQRFGFYDEMTRRLTEPPS